MNFPFRRNDWISNGGWVDIGSTNSGAYDPNGLFVYSYDLAQVFVKKHHPHCVEVDGRYFCSSKCDIKKGKT